jgi:hypothetical protein
LCSTDTGSRDSRKMPRERNRRLAMTSPLEIVVRWVVVSGANQFQGCGSIFGSVYQRCHLSGRTSCLRAKWIRNHLPGLAGAVGLRSHQGPMVLADPGFWAVLHPSTWPQFPSNSTSLCPCSGSGDPFRDDIWWKEPGQLGLWFRPSLAMWLEQGPCFLSASGFSTLKCRRWMLSVGCILCQ